MSDLLMVWNNVSIASWWHWFLGLDRVDWSQGQVLLGWRYEMPAWAWSVITVVAVALAGWSYANLIGRGWPKMGLALIRTVLLVFLAVVLAGPILVQKREKVEPDWLLVLIDRSASMRIKDAYAKLDGATEPVSRQEAVRDLITRHADLFGPEQLGRDRRLIWLGFDSQVYPIEPSFLDDRHPLGASNGQTTLLRTAIEQGLKRASGRPISGIILFTDGRSPQSTGADLIRRLAQQAVSVFPIPIGAAFESVDLSLSRVEAPKQGFVNDLVPVTVWIDQYPNDAVISPTHLRVKLVDIQTGQVLDASSPGQNGLADPVRLVGRSEVAGRVSWRVILEYDPTSSQASSDPATPILRELITDNNHHEIHLEFVDRPIRVLYIDGYPRWEYRYLKNTLVRENSVLSSVMLISAEHGFAQEGDEPIARLPQTDKELQQFDVVVIGDVPADYFSLKQQSQLRDHVAEAGAGLLWIGGAYYTPYSYDATQLADLLPMYRPSLTQPIPFAGPMIVTATQQAQRLSVLALRDVESEMLDADSTSVRWPADLPGLRWVQSIGSLKPSVDILATASVNGQGESVPLVLRHRYGAGQILYVASDDTWRWRYGRGDLYFQQFWIQLIRLLGRHRIQEDTQRAQLSVSHHHIELDQTVVVRLNVRDSMLLERRLPRIATVVTAPTDAQDPMPLNVLERIDLLPDSDQGDSSEANSDSYRVYKAVWQPRHAGNLVLRVNEPVLRDLDISLSIEVLHPDDELRQPLPDHDRLEVLARLSGGQLVPPDQIEQLSTLIPNRARRTPNDIRQTLWDAPVTLFIAMVLLTIEWVGRKVIQLV